MRSSRGVASTLIISFFMHSGSRVGIQQCCPAVDTQYYSEFSGLVVCA